MEFDATSPVPPFTPPASDIDDPFIPYLTKGSTDKLVTDDQQYLSCGATSGIKSKKKRTKSKVATNRIHDCDQCPFSTLYRNDLLRHIRRHENKRFACTECNMPFMSLGHLNGHRESTHGIKQISDKRVWRKCEECEYKTRHSSDMSRHRRRHELALDSCKYCNRPFCHVGKLNEHMKREHGDIDIQTRNLKERNITKTCNGTESVTETNDVADHAANNSDIENECTDSYSKDEHAISNQMQSMKQSVNNKGTCLKKKNKNKKRVKDKVKVKKQQKPPKTVNDENDFNIVIEHADNSEQGIRSVKEKTNTVIGDCPEDRNSDTDFRKMINCAFCEFSVNTFNELQHHLDKHDIDELCNNSDVNNVQMYQNNEIDDINVDYVENAFHSESNITVNDEEINMMLLETEDGTQDTTEVDETFIQQDETFNTDYDLQLSDTDSEDNTDIEDTVSGYVSNSSTNSHEADIGEVELETTAFDGKLIQSEIRSNNKKKNDDSFESESTDIDADEFVDAVTILKRCVAKIESQSTDLFPLKPFACSKCFFTTGNLEYLKIHVEAHFFEYTRWEQYQK